MHYRAKRRPHTSIDQLSRLALCCLLAIGGAAFVVKGDGLEGYIWWFLLCVILGVLLQGNKSLSLSQRGLYAGIVGLFFILACAGLYIRFGLALSGIHAAIKGTSVGDVFKRLNILMSPALLALYLVIWSVTTLLILLAVLAEARLVDALKKLLGVPVDQISILKNKVTAIAVIVSLIVSAIAYFAGG